MSSKDNFLEAMESWAGIYLFRSLSEYFDYLKTTGVSMQQAYVLTYIYYHRFGKISDICEHMMVTAAAASQMVDRLEKSGLVERTTEPDDRRVRYVVLTEEGISFVKQSIAARKRWMGEIPEALSESQLDQISATLNLLVSAYQS